jgi:hypothetical protein
MRRVATRALSLLGVQQPVAMITSVMPPWGHPLGVTAPHRSGWALQCGARGSAQKVNRGGGKARAFKKRGRTGAASHRSAVFGFPRDGRQARSLQGPPDHAERHLANVESHDYGLR